MQDDQLDYHLDDIEPKLGSVKTKKPKALTIVLIVSSILILILIAIIIILVYKLNKNESKDNKDNNQENNNNLEYDIFGEKYINISYASNHKIINTFKDLNTNYEENIKQVNGGLDYDENPDRNIYDLYIPQYALDNKNNYNGIILWIHGGAWIAGKKENMNICIELNMERGFIQANMGYTLLNTTNDENTNIFRIIDEIKACISSIKSKLYSLNFTGELGLALGGSSAGAHLSLLYSYLVKDSDIKIKFVINMVGPIGLNPDYFYILKNKSTPLDIETFKNKSLMINAENSTIIQMKNYTLLVTLMNYFLGQKYSKEFLESMFKGKELDINNSNFTKMLDEVKYADVTKIKDKNKCPTLCIYGGVDNVAGIAQFAYLKEKADKDGRYLKLIYSKYAGHNFLEIDKSSPESIKDGINALRLMNSYILHFSELYFKGD